MLHEIKNDFLALSKKGRNDWRSLLLFVALLIALTAFASIVLDLIESPDFKDKEYEFVWDIFIDGLGFAIVLLGLIPGIKAIHKRNFTTLNGPGPFPKNEFLEGIVVWGLLIVIGSFFNQQKQWNYFIENGLNGSLVLIVPMMLLAIGIQSYTEEVVFRGYLLQILSLRIKNVRLLVFTISLLFGTLHAADGLTAILGITFFSFLLSYIVLKRTNLAFIAGVHLVHNFLFVYVLGERNPVETNDFLKFDPIEVGLFLIQILLLFVYIRMKQQRKKR